MLRKALSGAERARADRNHADNSALTTTHPRTSGFATATTTFLGANGGRAARFATATATVLGVALTLAACAGSPAAQKANNDATPQPNGSGEREVTVVLDWSPNTNHSGLYLAQDRGYFADAGLDVSIVQPGDLSGLDLLVPGDADFAYAFSETLAPAVEQGVDAVSVAAVIEDNTSSLLFEADSGITRPADLAGKTYGTWGSSLDIAIVEALVECDGGDPSKVQTAPLASEDVRIGLTQGQYDYVWVYDAWDTIRLRDVDGLDVATIPFIEHTDCIPNWYTPVVATMRSTLDDDPQLVADFLGALRLGYQDAMREPDAAADALLAAAPELNEELVRLSTEYLSTRYADSPEAWGLQDQETWSGFIGFLAEHELMGGGIDPTTVWTNEGLE